MDEQDRKRQAVDDFLEAVEPAKGRDMHLEKLHILFPRNLQSADKADLEEMRIQILARQAPQRSPLRLPLARSLSWLAAAAALFLVGLTVILVGPFKQHTPTDGIPVAGVTKKMQSETIENSVRIFYRHGSGVMTVVRDRELTLTATKLQAMFDFEPNEKIRKVTIVIGSATYSVIGTRFILDCSDRSQALMVQSGKVGVSQSNKTLIATAGQTLTIPAANANMLISRGGHGRLFEQFATLPADSVLTDKTGQSRAEPPKESSPGIPIVLHLKNGTIVKGNRISQDENSIQVQLAGGQVITLQKIEILEAQ